MLVIFITGITILFGLFLTLMPKMASAHCDTMDGPAVKDGRIALETGNINYAYKWIFEDFEGELKEIFDLSLKVRKLPELLWTLRSQPQMRVLHWAICLRSKGL